MFRVPKAQADGLVKRLQQLKKHVECSPQQTFSEEAWKALLSDIRTDADLFEKMQAIMARKYANG